MLRGVFRRLSFEDRFDRKYASWVRNNSKKWAYDKRKNVRESRRKLKKELKEEIREVVDD